MSVVTVTKQNFQKEILESNQTVLVDFWAGWCGPCKMLSPIIDEIANENPDIKVCKINIDEEMELSQEYKVMSIPTVMVFKNGKAVDTSVGFKPKDAILSMIK